jgi:hypothetical protein
LNLIRQALFFNVDFYRSRGEGAWGMEEKWLINHVQHCLEYYRELTLCNAETGVIPFYQGSAAEPMMLDYRQRRRCGDFQAVLRWAWDHEIAIADS